MAARRQVLSCQRVLGLETCFYSVGALSRLFVGQFGVVLSAG